jgi:hypothetical protein
MIEALMTIMSSSGIGAITGGVFGWLNRREDRKMRKSDQEHEIQLIGVQTDAETQTSEARAFESSQKTISKVGDAIKSAVRPVITGALLYMTWGILQELERLTGGISNLPSEVAASLYRDITLNIISLTAVAVSWWFASRPSSITRK